jgi:ferric-dicitrate binding protein FerR (iron transport regulator)
MDKKLLYKMFEGRASDQDITQIREWVNENKHNRVILSNERKLFDVIQFNESKEKAVSHTKKISFRTIAASVAAAIITLFILYGVSYLSKENTTTSVAYNTVTVPAGQRVELQLADGTHVWLNALSKISYPVSFNGKKREVFLKGEALFDVAKEKNKKFIVHAGHCDVEVLGTLFNVEAYKENEFSTALMRGRVKVTDNRNPDKYVLLKPNNLVNLTNGELVVSQITDFNPYTWKDGLITFKNISFRDLIKKIERNYGLTIVIENSKLDHYACSGKFRISDGIEEILKALQQDAHFTYERENGNEIHIR